MNLYAFNPTLTALGLPDYTLGSRGLTPSFNSGGYTETPTGAFGPMSNRTAVLAGGGVPEASTGGLTPVPMYANVPLPPVRPKIAMAAGSGLHAFNQALIDPENAPQPPPRPQNLTVQPSANQLLQANAAETPWNAKAHSPIDNILHLFGQNNGLGGAIGGLGQGISNGLSGIFSGLFGGSGGNDQSSDHSPFI